MSDYAKALGARLRDVRQREGLSLHRVEQKSDGRWKAVVVGSYERGDRAVTVHKLAELARFYGVPLSELLPPDDLGAIEGVVAPIVINLERLREMPEEEIGPMIRYAEEIARHRGEHGTLLQVRSADIDTMSELCAMTRAELVSRLVASGVLAAGVASTPATSR
ncbi:MAG: helix-turn-helix domain-containing protein [Mycobacteriaceae bacterium]